VLARLLRADLHKRKRQSHSLGSDSNDSITQFPPQLPCEVSSTHQYTDATLHFSSLQSQMGIYDLICILFGLSVSNFQN